MATFNVERGFSGHIRGRRMMQIEANSEEEALEKFRAEEDYLPIDIIRDDSYKQEIEIELDVPYVEPEPVLVVITETMHKLRNLLKRI